MKLSKNAKGMTVKSGVRAGADDWEARNRR
jgi:hypothetical protein